VGNPFPSTGDVEYRSDETVTVEDFAWTPSHIRRNEVVEAVDVLRAERITFWRMKHEDLYAVEGTKRLALLVGHTGTAEKPSPGWTAQGVNKAFHWDLTPGESLTFIVEDYFDFRTLCEGMLWIQNTEGRRVHALVTERVLVDGGIDSFTLFDGTLLGKSIQPVVLPQPVTLPERVVFHEVTLRNTEADYDAYVIALISGWVGHTTYLPAELPVVYGEGLR
jgi:hypothetical protein